MKGQVLLAAWGGGGGNVLKDAGGMTFPPGKGDFHSHIVEGGEW